jgi:hypothetical protein
MRDGRLICFLCREASGGVTRRMPASFLEKVLVSSA